MMFFKKKKDEIKPDYRFVDKDKVNTIEDIKNVLEYMRVFSIPVIYEEHMKDYYRTKI